MYRALVAERDATRSMVAELSQRLFGGDVSRLVSHLLKEHEVGADDVRRMREMIEAHEDDAEGRT